MSLNKLAKEFNGLYGVEQVDLESIAEWLTTVKHVHDEYQEMCDEVTDMVNMSSTENTFNNAIKEAVDTIYITMTELAKKGVDVDAALAEVHRSNMSKALPDYTTASVELSKCLKRYPAAEIKRSGNQYVLRCGETGKVIKPEGTYSPAVIDERFYS